MRFRFNSMNEIGELDRFLDEKHGNIIPDQIPISFGCVKLGGEAANVSNGILRQETSRVSMERVVQYETYSTTTRALDCAKPYKHRGLTRRIGQDGCICVFGSSIVVDFEIAVGTCPASVDNALWDALVIEMHDLLTRQVIF